METIKKIKIKLQRHKLKKAYLRYMSYVRSLNCGEQLALFMTSAGTLRLKLEKEYEKMKILDKNCPPLELNLIQ